MSKFEVLFAALVINCHNMKMLHWGASGRDFDTFHDLANEYHEHLGEFTDDVAEIILMTENTVPDICKCIGILRESDHVFDIIGSDGNLTVNSSTFLEKTNSIFERLLSLYEDACDDIPDDIESKLHEHMYWIRKELTYKNKHRA